MAFGLGVLRLPPQAFWALSPRELKAAHDGIYGRENAPLSRLDLENLMQAYPDKE